MIMYHFDMTKLTLGDYVDIQAKQNTIEIACKCSSLDVHTIPLSELPKFLEDFALALTQYIQTQLGA